MVSLSVSISKDKEYYLTIAGCEVCFEMVKSQVYKGLYKVKAIIEFFSIDNIAQYQSSLRSMAIVPKIQLLFDKFVVEAPTMSNYQQAKCDPWTFLT